MQRDKFLANLLNLSDLNINKYNKEYRLVKRQKSYLPSRFFYKLFLFQHVQVLDHFPLLMF